MSVAILPFDPTATLPQKMQEAATLGQALCLGDLEMLAHNEMMLANALVKAGRYSEAALWAMAYADVLGRLAEAHDGEPARREITLHGDWLKQKRTDMRFAIRKDERRSPGTESATIRNARQNIVRGL